MDTQRFRRILTRAIRILHLVNAAVVLAALVALDVAVMVANHRGQVSGGLPMTFACTLFGLWLVQDQVRGFMAR